MRCNSCRKLFKDLGNFVHHIVDCFSWKDKNVDVMKFLTEAPKDEEVQLKGLAKRPSGIAKKKKQKPTETESSAPFVCFCGEPQKTQEAYRTHVEVCIAKCIHSIPNPAAQTRTSPKVDEGPPAQPEGAGVATPTGRNSPPVTEQADEQGGATSARSVEEITMPEIVEVKTSGFENEYFIDERSPDEYSSDGREAVSDSSTAIPDENDLKKELIIAHAGCVENMQDVVGSLQQDIVAHPDGIVVGSEVEIGTYHEPVENDPHRSPSGSDESYEPSSDEAEEDEEEEEEENDRAAKKPEMKKKRGTNNKWNPGSYVGKKVTLDVPKMMFECDCDMSIPTDDLVDHLKSCPALLKDKKLKFWSRSASFNCDCGLSLNIEKMPEHMESCPALLACPELDLSKKSILCHCSLTITADRIAEHLELCPAVLVKSWPLNPVAKFVEVLPEEDVTSVPPELPPPPPITKLAERLQAKLQSTRSEDSSNPGEDPNLTPGPTAGGSEVDENSTRSPQETTKSPQESATTQAQPSGSTPVLITCVCKKKFEKSSIKTHLLQCATWKLVKKERNLASAGQDHDSSSSEEANEEKDGEEKRKTPPTDTTGRADYYVCECNARFKTSNVYKVHLRTCPKSGSSKFEDALAFRRENVMLTFDSPARGEVLTDRTCECGFRIESICDLRQHSASCPKASKPAENDPSRNAPLESAKSRKAPRPRTDVSESSEDDFRKQCSPRSKRKPAKKRKVT